MNFTKPTLLFLLFGGSLAFSQSTTPTSGDSLSSDDETIVLSPFTVNAEQDTGYQAQSTLAGSRLATPLKDLGASISVYTKDFMKDIGATTAEELLVYATGMDAAGSQGNYSASAGSIGQGEVVGDGPRTSSNGSSRTRGLAGPEYTRGYFSTRIGYDSYNTGATTVSRGPNAVLFGAGSPAGVIDSAPVDASLRRDSTQIENRVGDNGSMRNVLDINRVFWDKKIAVRLMGLDDKENYDQRPAHTDKSRVYGALNFKPFDSTGLRVNFEAGSTRANRPITVLPFNSTATWFEAGMPTHDWKSYDDPTINPAASTTNADFRRPQIIGQAQLFNVVVVPFDAGGGLPGVAFRGQQQTGNGINRLRDTIYDPNLNQDSARDGINFYETYNISESQLPASYFPGGVRPIGIKAQGFTDYSAFAFNKRLIDETSFQNDDFNSLSLAFEQSFWKDNDGQDRLGIELAYHRERVTAEWVNSFFSQANGNHVRVDANATLPNGDPNPNFLRPWVAGGNNADNRTRKWEDEARRATAFLRFDFDDISPTLGEWLGRHTLTGLYEETSRGEVGYNKRRFIGGRLGEALNSNPAAFGRRVNYIAYIGPQIPAGGSLVLEPIRNVDLGSPVATVKYFRNDSTSSTVQGSVVTEDMPISELLTGGSASRRLLESSAAVLQSYWLKDHVITTAGVRRDSEFQTRYGGFGYSNYPTFDGDFSFDDFDLPYKGDPVDSGTTKSFGVVVRWPRGLIPLPQGMDASVFYNKSDNFTPSGTRVSAYNELLPSPQGETEEFGVAISLFDDKLSMRLNRFETSVVGQSFNSSVYTDAYNIGLRQMAEYWAAEREVAGNGNIDRTAEINQLRAAAPEFFEQINFQLLGDGTPGNTYRAEYTTFSNITDTTDFTAEGYEFEMVYNPTPGWRILMNVSKQETVQSNLAPLTKELVARMRPVWTNLANNPRLNYPENYNPATSDPITSTVGRFLEELEVDYATLLAQEGQVSAEQRKWRVNVVSNYTFRDGRLKGFGVGSGVRWQDKYAIGYPTGLNPDGSVFVDIDNPYWGDSDLNVDAWVSYKLKILKDKVDWSVQLNVKNLIGDGAPIAITAQYDGSTAVTRLPPEKRIYLSNTFSF